jgi:NADPH-dependent 2,4-dienoyl-CoA reductase/sulfur reductase-like enzyme
VREQDVDQDRIAHRRDGGRERPPPAASSKVRQNPTGGRNRSLDLPGADLDGVLQLRSQADCDRIRAAARAGEQVVVAGMSFIGSEVAASLARLDVHVTAVFPGAEPLERVLGPEVGAVLGRVHRDRASS